MSTNSELTKKFSAQGSFIDITDFQGNFLLECIEVQDFFNTLSYLDPITATDLEATEKHIRSKPGPHILMTLKKLSLLPSISPNLIAFSIEKAAMRIQEKEGSWFLPNGGVKKQFWNFHQLMQTAAEDHFEIYHALAAHTAFGKVPFKCNDEATIKKIVSTYKGHPEEFSKFIIFLLKAKSLNKNYPKTITDYFKNEKINLLTDMRFDIVRDIVFSSMILEGIKSSKIHHYFNFPEKDIKTYLRHLFTQDHEFNIYRLLNDFIEESIAENNPAEARKLQNNLLVSAFTFSSHYRMRNDILLPTLSKLPEHALSNFIRHAGDGELNQIFQLLNEMPDNTYEWNFMVDFISKYKKDNNPIWVKANADTLNNLFSNPNFTDKHLKKFIACLDQRINLAPSTVNILMDKFTSDFSLATQWMKYIAPRNNKILLTDRFKSDFETNPLFLADKISWCHENNLPQQWLTEIQKTNGTQNQFSKIDKSLWHSLLLNGDNNNLKSAFKTQESIIINWLSNENTELFNDLINHKDSQGKTLFDHADPVFLRKLQIRFKKQNKTVLANKINDYFSQNNISFSANNKDEEKIAKPELKVEIQPQKIKPVSIKDKDVYHLPKVMAIFAGLMEAEQKKIRRTLKFMETNRFTRQVAQLDRKVTFEQGLLVHKAGKNTRVMYGVDWDKNKIIILDISDRKVCYKSQKWNDKTIQRNMLDKLNEARTMQLQRFLEHTR